MQLQNQDTRSTQSNSLHFDYLKDSRKSIEPKEFRKIHDLARAAVQDLKTKEVEVICALQKVDQFKVYRFLGFNSLFQYALSLGLSEHQSYNFITVARKSVDCPQLQKAIENKEITISKAKTITSVIEEKNQMHWLELAKTLPKRELEKEVARVSPKAIKKESARFVTDKILELNVTVSEDTFRMLERVKELMAQKERKYVTLEEALKVLAEGYINKQDPVEIAKRVVSKKNRRSNNEKSKQVTQITLNDLKQKDLPSKLVPRRGILKSVTKHEVYFRDQGKCQYKDRSGTTCNERKWIDIHHKIPKSQGGSDTVENLITLCKSHHSLVHERY